MKLPRCATAWKRDLYKQHQTRLIEMFQEFAELLEKLLTGYKAADLAKVDQEGKGQIDFDDMASL